MEFLSPGEKKAAAGFSGLAWVGVLLPIFINFGISFLLGGTIEATWILLLSLQLVSFIPLISLYIPSVFRAFSKNLMGIHG